MKALKYVVVTLLLYGVGCLALRGAMSFYVPMGMECDAAYMTERERPCVLGPGVVGKQKCLRGKWHECEAGDCRWSR